MAGHKLKVKFVKGKSKGSFFSYNNMNKSSMKTQKPFSNPFLNLISSCIIKSETTIKYTKNLILKQMIFLFVSLQNQFILFQYKYFHDKWCDTTVKFLNRPTPDAYHNQKCVKKNFEGIKQIAPPQFHARLHKNINEFAITNQFHDKKMKTYCYNLDEIR